MRAAQQRLYMLPFDHRGSFAHQLLGLPEPLDAEAKTTIGDAKRLIYEGFLQALEGGLPHEASAILVDEQFGRDILADANARGIRTACPVERSGQPEFLFEYGESYPEHIEAMDPTFAKVLVRYNVEGDTALNARQGERLRTLSDYLRARGRGLLFELLVPAEPHQRASAHGDSRTYDTRMRPSLTAAAIEALQTAGVEPTVWKVEGLASTEDCHRIAEATRRGGRDGVTCIVLGRNADEAQVDVWLHAAAQVPAFVGFAVGRSTFAAPLVAWRNGHMTRPEAAGEIGRRYLHWTRVFTDAQSDYTATALGLAP